MGFELKVKSFTDDIQTHPAWSFCREHVKESMFFRYEYYRMTIRKIPLMFVKHSKCDFVENGKRCSENARYNVLYETSEMIERNSRLKSSRSTT